jgi:leucine-rich repeat protein SHOC2
MIRRKFYDLQSALRVPEQVEQLVLYQRGLQEWPRELLRFTNLRSLDLSGNFLSLVPDWISELPQLEELVLSHNQLDSFPELDRLAKPLRKIGLAHNRITTIPATLEGGLALIALDLSQNPLTNGWEHLGQLPSLEVLKLVGIGLTRIPPGWKQLSRLKQVSLQKNRISRLPKVGSCWPQLQHLDISGNRLQIVGPSLNGFPQLRQLHLSSNRLRYFEPELAFLSQLQYLDLSRNKLETLPTGWTGLLSLRELILAHNKIKNLPEDLVAAARLRMLDAASNKLEVLPESFGDLPQLQHLILAGNPLRELPVSLNNLPLRRLDLRRTRIRTIPDSFWKLEKLTELKGPRGATSFLRFLKSCQKQAVPVSLRALLFGIYQSAEPIAFPWRPELFWAGLCLPYHKLHQRLWAWHRIYHPLVPLNHGARIALSRNSGFRKKDLEKAGLLAVGLADHPTHVLVTGDSKQERVAGLPLLSRSELREYLNSSNTPEVEGALIDRLTAVPTEANILFLSTVIRGKTLRTEQLEQLVCCWLGLKAGKGRRELTSTLQPHFTMPIPRTPIVEMEEVTARSVLEELLRDRAVDIEKIWKCWQNKPSSRLK